MSRSDVVSRRLGGRLTPTLMRFAAATLACVALGACASPDARTLAQSDDAARELLEARLSSAGDLNEAGRVMRALGFSTKPGSISLADGANAGESRRAVLDCRKYIPDFTGRSNTVVEARIAIAEDHRPVVLRVERQTKRE